MDSITTIDNLEKKIEKLCEQSISLATKKAYRTDWKLFLEFCDTMNLPALPANTDTICLYLASLSEKSAVSTIVRKVTSISMLHKFSGYDSPTKNEKIATILSGIKRSKQTAPKKASSINFTIIKKMIAQCDGTIMGVRDAAILSLGWSSAMRRSELCNLKIGDLSFEDRGLLIDIHRSKTDQEGKGCKIAIPFGSEICPVALTKRWIDRRSSIPLPPNEYLFTSLGNRARGRWHWPSIGRLDDRMISKIVKRYASFAGLDASNFSAHSLRRGMATEAASRGVPERIISRHTRHRSIAVLRGYIDDGTIWIDNPLTAIFSSCASVSSSD
jgi:integrase